MGRVIHLINGGRFESFFLIFLCLMIILVGLSGGAWVGAGRWEGGHVTGTAWPDAV